MARIDQTTNSLAVDTDVLFVNITNNRVGINQNTPNTALHVVGATTVDGDITSTSGTIKGVNLVVQAGGGGSLTFADGTSMSTAPSAPDLAGSIATGQVAFGASANTIAGNNNLFWDNANARLGIGTNSPSSSLHIIGVDDDNPEVRVQRNGVTNQFVSIMNEDAGGGFVNSESNESNKKPLYLQSIHDGGGSANGSNSIILRTGAASSPVERVIITDNTSPSAAISDPQFIIQSGTYLLVDDSIRVGFTSGASPTDYTISARQTTANISGGLFCSSIGESAISNANAGWWLTVGGMSASAKYTPALKFGSEDTAFTTDSPKYLAGIVGRATETYSTDTTGGMAIDFLTFPNGGGANGGPTTRMSIGQDGHVGIGTTTPAYTLDVNGGSDNQIGVFRSTDATSRVNFVDDSTSSDTHVGIGAVGNAIKLWAGNALAITAAQSGNIGFNSGKLAEYNGAAPTAGQLLIGSAGGGVWEAATLTAGSNVTITNADGAITIAATGGGGGTDELVKTSATDAAAGFLETKITQGNNVSILVNIDPISSEQNLVVSATDNQVAGTTGDLTPGALDQKMVAGAGISLAVVNDPLLGDQVQVTATGGGGGGGSPGGAFPDVQINDGSGGFYGDADFTYNPSTPTLTIGGSGGRAELIHAGSFVLAANSGSGRIQGRDLTIQSDITMIADDVNKSVGFYASQGIPQYTVGDPSGLPPDPAVLQAWLIELYLAIGPQGMNIIA